MVKLTIDFNSTYFIKIADIILLYMILFIMINTLPVHVLPSEFKEDPLEQPQTYVPLVLIHLCSHKDCVLWHSSTSEVGKIKIKDINANKRENRNENVKVFIHILCVCDYNFYAYSIRLELYPTSQKGWFTNVNEKRIITCTISTNHTMQFLCDCL